VCTLKAAPKHACTPDHARAHALSLSQYRMHPDTRTHAGHTQRGGGEESGGGEEGGSECVCVREADRERDTYTEDVRGRFGRFSEGGCFFAAKQS
jgi:hypothetical protein